MVYEGEITEYRPAEPTSATAQQTAAQSRMVIVINVRFINKKKESDNFEKKFTHFFDYSGSDPITASLLSRALDEIYGRITQDVFNDSLAKW